MKWFDVTWSKLINYLKLNNEWSYSKKKKNSKISALPSVLITNPTKTLISLKIVLKSAIRNSFEIRYHKLRKLFFYFGKSY